MKLAMVFLVLLVVIAGLGRYVYRTRPVLPWALYLSARTILFQILGRNPLCAGGLAPTFRRNLEMVKARKINENVKKLAEDADGRTLWHTDLGDFWLPPGTQGDFVGFLAGEQAANTYQYAELDGAVVMDCGANVGTFARFVLDRGASKVIAVEPSQSLVACLRKTFDKEIAAGRLMIVDVGVWDREDRLFLTNNTRNPGANKISDEQSEKGEWVHLTTIDALAEQHKLDRLDFLKLDIEGAECVALAGARETVKRFHPRISVGTEHTDDLYANAEAVLSALRSIDSSYRYNCTFCGIVASRKWGGRVLTPVGFAFR